jgi:hypothetical protein
VRRFIGYSEIAGLIALNNHPLTITYGLLELHQQFHLLI